MLNFCMCCQKEKTRDEFFVKKNSTKPSNFCKKCYIDYSREERAKRQFKYIFDIIKEN